MFLYGSTCVDPSFSGARIAERCKLISPLRVNLHLS